MTFLCRTSPLVIEAPQDVITFSRIWGDMFSLNEIQQWNDVHQTSN